MSHIGLFIHAFSTGIRLTRRVFTPFLPCLPVKETSIHASLPLSSGTTENEGRKGKEAEWEMQSWGLVSGQGQGLLEQEY